MPRPQAPIIGSACDLELLLHRLQNTSVKGVFASVHETRGLCRHHFTIISASPGPAQDTPSMSAAKWFCTASYIFFDLTSPGIVMKPSDSWPGRDLILIFSKKHQEMLRPVAFQRLILKSFCIHFRLNADSGPSLQTDVLGNAPRHRFNNPTAWKLKGGLLPGEPSLSVSNSATCPFVPAGTCC